METKWNNVIQNALFLYMNKDNITYCLGCSGEVITTNKVKEQFTYYYNHDWKNKIGITITGWTATMTADQAYQLWSEQHKNNMCFDCSGFIDFCLGYQGVHKYSSWDFQKGVKNKSIAEGVAGSVLWKSGHVGLDIGYGYEIEIGEYGQTLKLRWIKDRNFTESHLLPGIDYTGADAR